MSALLLFMLINFASLGIGGALLGNPKTNTWYQSINKAPWTPPNWFFGVAWTSIMICFAVYLWLISKQFSTEQLKVFYIIYAIQFVLNVAWNPVFFRWHIVTGALVIIIALVAIVAWFTVWGFVHAGFVALLMLPYLLWLLVAGSLNGYVLAKN